MWWWHKRRAGWIWLSSTPGAFTGSRDARVRELGPIQLGWRELELSGKGGRELIRRKNSLRADTSPRAASTRDQG
jgi:hypothetical protein